MDKKSFTTCYILVSAILNILYCYVPYFFNSWKYIFKIEVIELIKISY